MNSEVRSERDIDVLRLTAFGFCKFKRFLCKNTFILAETVVKLTLDLIFTTNSLER